MSTAVWKGHLTFGLVSIPMKLYRAARAEKVNFRQLHRTWTPSADPAPARAALSGPSTRLQRNAPSPSAPESRVDKTSGPAQTLRMPAVETVSPTRQQVVAEAAESPVAKDQF